MQNKTFTVVGNDDYKVHSTDHEIIFFLKKDRIHVIGFYEYPVFKENTVQYKST